MGTVSVRRCTACNALTAEWGECRKCGAVPGETAGDLENRMQKTVPLPADVAEQIAAMCCQEADKMAVRAFARRLIAEHPHREDRHITRLPECGALRCGAPDLNCTKRRIAGEEILIPCYIYPGPRT